VIHELDALANIDFKTREKKSKHTALNIFRIGTSGALQKEIPLNAFIISEYGLGIDGLLNFYLDKDHTLEYELAEDFLKYTSWPPYLSKPYAAKCSEKLMGKIGNGLLKGITITAPGFYGPQGRVLRIKPSSPASFDKIDSFTYKDLKISNFEMETSALYGLCKILGHEALTICVAIANRATHEYNQQHDGKIEELIQTFLERLRNRI
jgi:uridine phosphorylase